VLLWLFLLCCTCLFCFACRADRGFIVGSITMFMGSLLNHLCFMLWYDVLCWCCALLYFMLCYAVFCSVMFLCCILLWHLPRAVSVSCCRAVSCCICCVHCCVMLYRAVSCYHHLHELSEAGACRLTGMLKRELLHICLCAIEQLFEPWRMLMLASQRQLPRN
jgi:hypothetical protein